MIRLILYASMTFLTAFAGVTWASRGFPMQISRPEIVAPLQPRVTATFGDQSDKDPRLDSIRLDALQAANAYAMAPCGETVKANLIAAVSAYARAWQQKLDCPRPLNMLMFCGDKKLQEVAATFSTPLDIRVKAALSEAFEQRGIVKADFPADLRSDVLQFTGPGLWFDESPICLPRMRAAAGSQR